jgi:hypothetical protein
MMVETDAAWSSPESMFTICSIMEKHKRDVLGRRQRAQRGNPSIHLPPDTGCRECWRLALVGWPSNGKSPALAAARARSLGRAAGATLRYRSDFRSRSFLHALSIPSASGIKVRSRTPTGSSVTSDTDHRLTGMPAEAVLLVYCSAYPTHRHKGPTEPRERRPRARH